MIISGPRKTGETLYPTYWHGDYAAYEHKGGCILAHIPTKQSVFFQAGDEATAFQEVAGAAMELCTDEDPRAWDEAMSLYLDFMEPADIAGGTPSSDGGFWAFFA